jgi:hypothetical protein
MSKKSEIEKILAENGYFVGNDGSIIGPSGESKTSNSDFFDFILITKTIEHALKIVIDSSTFNKFNKNGKGWFNKLVQIVDSTLSAKVPEFSLD